MSKEAVAKIKEAEEEALRIKNQAVAKSKEMIDNAEKSGNAHLGSVEKKTSEDYEARLAAMRVAATKALEKSRADIENEAEELRNTAKTKMPKAINVILGGILEECR